MRAVVVDHDSSPVHTGITDVPAPSVGDADVLIKVIYCGMNPADWKGAAGMMKDFFPADGPCIIGFEGSGVVSQLGQAVRELKLGDRVMFGRGALQQGTYAEYIALPAAQIFRVPDSIALHEAATLPACFRTAHNALFAPHLGALEAGQKVLIHGGAGGVGSYAVQLAKHSGALVAATGRTANADYLASLGADYVIDYSDPDKDVVTSLREWASEGIDLVLDVVGMGTLRNPLDALKPGRKLVNIFTLDDGDVEKDIAEAERRGFKKIVAMADLSQKADTVPMERLIGEGAIKIPPVEVYDLDQLDEAFAKLKTGHVRGKLALRFSPEQ